MLVGGRSIDRYFAVFHAFSNVRRHRQHAKRKGKKKERGTISGRFTFERCEERIPKKDNKKKKKNKQYILKVDFPGKSTFRFPLPFVRIANVAADVRPKTRFGRRRYPPTLSEERRFDVANRRHRRMHRKVRNDEFALSEFDSHPKIRNSSFEAAGIGSLEICTFGCIKIRLISRFQ